MPLEVIAVPERSESEAMGAPSYSPHTRQAPGPSSWLLHLVVLGTLSSLAVVLFWKAPDVPAYDTDNLFSLSLGPLVDTRQSLLSLLTEPYAHLPAYRPVPLFTLWLQYKLVGLAPESYFVVNIVLLVGMCAVLYALVYCITGSWAAGCGSAFVLLVDPRGTTAIRTIVERQTAIACLLGLLALLVVLAPPVRAGPRPIAVAVFLLLLLAALSKEYGLAFSAAVLVAALLNRSARSKPIAFAALGAVLAYAALRWGVVGGTTGDYCDDMGYFEQVRRVCFGHAQTPREVLLTGGAELAQHAYNVGAAFLGTFFPFLFSGKGALTSSVSVPLAMWSLIVTGLAIVAWVRIPRRALPFLVLIVANSVLGLTLYRQRNLLVGVAGLYAAAALGAVQAEQWLRSRDIRLARTGVAAAGVVALWVGYQGLGRANDFQNLYRERARGIVQIMQNNKKVLEKKNPCRYLTPRFAAEHAGTAPILPTVVQHIKLRYHLPDPLCLAHG
jgi:hypothetical protein